MGHIWPTTFFAVRESQDSGRFQGAATWAMSALYSWIAMMQPVGVAGSISSSWPDNFCGIENARRLLVPASDFRGAWHDLHGVCAYTFSASVSIRETPIVVPKSVH